MKKRIAEKIDKISKSILIMAGVYTAPGPDNRPAGVSRTGQAVFVANNLANSDNTDAGAGFIHLLAMFVSPFNVLSKKELQAIERNGKIASSRLLIRDLDVENAKQNAGRFGAILIRAIGSVTSHALAATTAYKLYDHWGIMSPAQKSIAIAAMSIQLHKTDEGGAVCDLKIISGKDQEFKVSDALKMVQSGKNPYPLVLNWAQIYRLSKVYMDNPTIESLMDFAGSHKLIGQGINDSAVPNVTKKAIETNGGRAAPQYGVGAVVMPKDKMAPEGYADAVQLEDSKISVPKANANTASGALLGSLVGTKAGVNGISTEALATYSKWNKDDRRAVDKGSDGGSTLVSALTAMKKSNRFMYGAMLAFLARYTHEDIDSANASHYLASLAGISLARIVSGRSSKEADSDGIKLAQAVNANNPADFAKLQIQMRALYANFGINSKSDAYQLSNQAYAEGRINDSDLVAMHQVYDLIYNTDAFGELEQILEGRNKGLEIVRTEAPDAANKMTDGQAKISKEVIKEMSIEEVKARNRVRYAKKEAINAQQAQLQDQSQQPQAEAPAPTPQQEPSAIATGG